MSPSPRPLEIAGAPVKEDVADRFEKAVRWLVQTHEVPHVQAEKIVRVLWDRAFEAVDRERVHKPEPIGRTTSDPSGW